MTLSGWDPDAARYLCWNLLQADMAPTTLTGILIPGAQVIRFMVAELLPRPWESDSPCGTTRAILRRRRDGIFCRKVTPLERC
jgi:hypothetical protein